MSDGRNTASQRLDAAINWHVRLSSDAAGESDWLAFTVWLEADTANRLAFDKVEEDAGLPTEAMTHVAGERGLSHPEIPQRSFRNAYQLPRNWVLGVIALAAAAAALLLWPTSPLPSKTMEYSTGIGEARSITLGDGSVVDLNTATTIRIPAEERHVTLLNGEALFHVTKDTGRVFEVTTTSGVVRVLGTIFDVLRDKSQTRVTVAEGKVLFAAIPPNTGRTFTLNAGDQLTYTVGNYSQVNHVDPHAALAWQRGYLIYEDARLPDVVADVNRYFAAKLVIGEAEIARRHFSGVLKLDRQDVFVQRLERLLGVRAEYRNKTIVLRSSATRN